MNEHGLSESGEHESETDDDGKLPVQQNSASAQSPGCAQRGNPKTQTDKNKIKTHLTRPASLEMSHYRPVVLRARRLTFFGHPRPSQTCALVAQHAAPLHHV